MPASPQAARPGLPGPSPCCGNTTCCAPPAREPLPHPLSRLTLSAIQSTDRSISASRSNSDTERNTRISPGHPIAATSRPALASTPGTPHNDTARTATVTGRPVPTARMLPKHGQLAQQGTGNQNWKICATADTAKTGHSRSEPAFSVSWIKKARWIGRSSRPSATRSSAHNYAITQHPLFGMGGKPADRPAGIRVSSRGLVPASGTVLRVISSVLLRLGGLLMR